MFISRNLHTQKKTHLCAPFGLDNKKQSDLW